MKLPVIVFFLVICFMVVSAEYGHADSIICDDLIFTETSDIEAIPTTPDGTIFKGTIPVKKIKYYSVGAYVYLHQLENNEIYFNQLTQCMTIEDEVNSVKNLRWFLQHSKDARISLWKHRRE